MGELSTRRGLSRKIGLLVDSMAAGTVLGVVILSVVGLSVVGLVGCSGSDGLPDMVPIRGKVTFDGKPMREGTVIYSPRERGQGRQASGGIQPDGSFVLTTLKKADGVKKGDYQIAIYAMEPHPGEPKSRAEVEAMGGKIKRGFVIPEKYTNPATSGLSDTVDDQHAGFKQIELVK